MNPHANSPDISHGILSRRAFICSTVCATGGVLSGCATNPVTGKTQLVLMSEKDEINQDQMAAPHAFSADYGAVQDDGLNAYVSELGRQLGAISHRSHMPYNFRALNSNQANAYTLPAGSIGITRSLLMHMKNEAELSSVLAHEIGHVCMRHAATRMAQGILTQLIAAGISEYVAEKNEEYAALALGLGQISAGALQASYSRKDEHEADDLGMQYMVRIGQNPIGMVQVMDTLRKMHASTPDIIERMMSSHPMSSERYRIALERAQGKYAHAMDNDLHRERFMDHTAGLRRYKVAIRLLEQGMICMMQQKYPEAEQHYTNALKRAPNDYAGLLMMANCCNAQNKNRDAFVFGQRAHEVYPEEPQSVSFLGFLHMQSGNFGTALEALATYRKILPGNASIDFGCGYCLEKMGRRQDAAQEYLNYLKQSQQGEQAQHAYNTLVRWGVIKPEPAGEGSSS